VVVRVRRKDPVKGAKVSQVSVSVRVRLGLGLGLDEDMVGAMDGWMMDGWMTSSNRNC
jgi:hypothetical protein